jgi:hypothetical protein
MALLESELSSHLHLRFRLHLPRWVGQKGESFWIMVPAGSGRFSQAQHLTPSLVIIDFFVQS